MVRTSVLNDALKNINNAEKAGKRQVLIRPSSKVIFKFVELMQKNGYVREFEEVDDHWGGKLGVQLTGRLSKCGVISPRFNVRLSEMEKWAVRLLLLVTSVMSCLPRLPAGVMTHEEARRKHVSGKIIGFFY